MAGCVERSEPSPRPNLHVVSERLLKIRTQSSRTIGRPPAHTTDLVTATIDLSAIRHNASVLQSLAGSADLMAVVKADAYGHGAIPVTKACWAEGIRHFAVARPAEGIRLRNAGLGGRILVLGAPLPEDLPTYAAHNLDLTVSSPDVAEAVIAAASSAEAAPFRAHVKVDTGMGRIGLSPDAAPALIRRLAGTPGVTLAGVWTHFATADDPGSAFARAQRDRFARLLSTLDVSAQHVHAANTGALLTLDETTAAADGPLVRTGIALYGMAATADLATGADLRPALRWTARVTHVKTVSAGTPVSYGATWRAERPTRIATLGVGYGDGYPRLGSGRAAVRIGGTLRPVVGTICMDMCMVDLGPPDGALAQRVDPGDEAVLLGPDGPTAYDVANWAETIPYEICCGISPRVPRRYVPASAPPTAVRTALVAPSAEAR